MKKQLVMMKNAVKTVIAQVKTKVGLTYLMSSLWATNFLSDDGHCVKIRSLGLLDQTAAIRGFLYAYYFVGCPRCR